MKTEHDSRATLTFLVIAIVLMVFIEFVIFPDRKPKIKIDVPEPTAQESLQDELLTGGYDLPVTKIHLPERPVVEVPKGPPLWKTNAVPVEDVAEGIPQIVIIIDDMGMDRRRSQAVLDLPGPLTLAFLPYAPDVDSLVGQAWRVDHEIMIHMPMEPLNPDLDTGPLTLRMDQSAMEFESVLDEALNVFEGYVGVNNHMGSRLTQDADAMNRLMSALKERGLLFVDSRTIAATVAFDIAAEQGIPHAERDVFLDHDPTPEGVAAALRRTERIAKAHGLAIAIGHPKDATIAGLQEWLPTLADKGIALVPVSYVVVE